MPYFLAKRKKKKDPIFTVVYELTRFQTLCQSRLVELLNLLKKNTCGLDRNRDKNKIQSPRFE